MSETTEAVVAHTPVVVNLGDEVKCLVTNLQGICTSLTRGLHGCRLVGIQPPVDKDGKLPEGYSVDEPTCMVVKAGAIPIPPSHPEEISVALGDEVVDPVTKFEGILVNETIFLNGCIRVAVQPTVNEKDGKFREVRHFDAPRLRLKEAKKVLVQSKDKPTGGPMGPLPPRY